MIDIASWRRLPPLALALLSAVWVGCSRPEPQAEQPTASASEQGEERPRIHAIPTFSVSAVLVPQAWPFPAQGLSFQMGELKLRNAQRHRPIGTACLGSHHEVALSFPQKDQIIIFGFPGYDLTAFGPKRTGGNGVPLQAPNRFRLFVDGLVSTSASNGLVFHLDEQGALTKVVDLGPVRDAAIGPDRCTLSMPEHGLHLLIRYDIDGKPEQHYGFGPEALRVPPPGASAFSGCIDILDNWEVVFVNRPVTVLYHFDRRTLVQRQFDLRLHTADEPAATENQDTFSDRLTAHAVRYFESAYWILLSAAHPPEKPESLMIRLDHSGRLISCWRLPFPADAFDIDETFILLAQRAAGSAQTYRFH